MSTNPEKPEGAKPEKKKRSEGSSKKTRVDAKLVIVQDVIRLMNEAEISELSFEQGGVKLHLRKGPGMPFAAAVTPTILSPIPVAAPSLGSPSPAAGQSAAGNPEIKSDTNINLNSPMVGTFYRSPAPDSKPFVEEGDKIAVGQVYCIIEAMKLMNEVKSEVAGKVVKILVQNGQAVEFNQTLLVVDPT
jgi:acetyl-CoA carboxylase biotin carboxyl carrier protein